MALYPLCTEIGNAVLLLASVLHYITLNYIGPLICMILFTILVLYLMIVTVITLSWEYWRSLNLAVWSIMNIVCVCIGSIAVLSFEVL